MSDVGRDPFSELLYPMLRDRPPVAEDVLAALATAPVEKGDETNRLRRRLADEDAPAIVGCAAAVAERVQRGGRVLACGNGGSATTAADLVADLLTPVPPRRPVAALSLSSDVATITAVSNDIGFEDVVVRQLIALGRPEDVLVAISTSGNSENLVRGLAAARSLGMLTVGITGYDGGRMAREGLDWCFVVRSSSVHRIQEAQTTLCHLLCELVQRPSMEELVCA